jgi:hypothetical protein
VTIHELTHDDLVALKTVTFASKNILARRVRYPGATRREMANGTMPKRAGATTRFELMLGMEASISASHQPVGVSSWARAVALSLVH